MTDNTYQIKEKLASLEEALLSSTPNIPILLKEIHRNLKNDPDIVTILTEEECSILVKGLKKQTATEIATQAVKRGTNKPLSKMGVGDL